MQGSGYANDFTGEAVMNQRAGEPDGREKRMYMLVSSVPNISELRVTSGASTNLPAQQNGKQNTLNDKLIGYQAVEPPLHAFRAFWPDRVCVNYLEL